MPIIKSAKKRMKQAEVRRQRNYPVRSAMKTHVKKVLLLTKEGKKDEAEKMLPETYKIIDTAAKKNIIHKNNAARKKSLLARSIANSSNKGAAPMPKVEKAATGATKGSSMEQSEAKTPKATKKAQKVEEVPEVAEEKA